MPLIRRDAEAEQPAVDRRCRPRDLDGLLEQLRDHQPKARRYAARELAGQPDAVPALCDALERETDATTRHALWTALMVDAGPEVAERVVPWLRSEDVALRNGVIELLQSMPRSVANLIDRLLDDADSDVRILACNVLEGLPHRHVPAWLCRVLEQESHVNVCATAVDVLAEAGDESCIPALERVAERFPDEPFMGFAVRTAIARIRGAGGDDEG